MKKTLLSLIAILLFAGIGINYYNSQEFSLSSIDKGRTTISNESIYAEYTNQGITNDDLGAIAKEVMSKYFQLTQQYHYIPEIRFNLNKNKITNPCKLFEVFQAQELTNTVIFNFADNQIEIPYCMDKIPIYESYEFNFANNGMTQQGYKEFKNLFPKSKKQYIEYLKINLSNNSPVNKEDLEFLSSDLVHVADLRLILKDMNLDNNFEIPADFYYISTLLLDISGNRLSNFDIIDNPVIKNLRRFYLNISNNKLDDNSNWALFESNYQKKSLQVLDVNLYGNNITYHEQDILKKLWHNYPQALINVNLDNSNYHFIY